ncbi:MAG: discoidin domain-containing protein, partial [Marinilabiliaceae bacterium]|nr:discoidin domain-containing protein [Marinilabiliaceae bacterium]
IIDLGELRPIAGFTYLPDQGRWAGGYAFNYAFFVSQDGKNWGKPVSSGKFSNIANSPVLQTKNSKVTTGRYVKLKALSIERGENQFGIAEFGVITK